jgi:hypothetical protein
VNCWDTENETSPINPQYTHAVRIGTISVFLGRIRYLSDEGESDEFIVFLSNEYSKETMMPYPRCAVPSVKLLVKYIPKDTVIKFVPFPYEPPRRSCRDMQQCLTFMFEIHVDKDVFRQIINVV